MKKLFCTILATLALGAALQGCGAKTEAAPPAQPAETSETGAAESGITAETAYEGVNNYCHEKFDWSFAEENPEAMYVAMGEESETEYQVIFRSYTGSLTYFYVDKADGTTRMTTYVPALDIEEEEGTIQIGDYLK